MRRRVDNPLIDCIVTCARPAYQLVYSQVYCRVGRGAVPRPVAPVKMHCSVGPLCPGGCVAVLHLVCTIKCGRCAEEELGRGKTPPLVLHLCLPSRVLRVDGSCHTHYAIIHPAPHKRSTFGLDFRLLLAAAQVYSTSCHMIPCSTKTNRTSDQSQHVQYIQASGCGA